jgi:mRNA interferase MazF
VKESEQGRPAVIISGNLMNQYLNVVIVCPLTTSVKNYKGKVVLSPNGDNNLNKPSEILTFHVRSVAKDRLTIRMGRISNLELTKVKQVSKTC